MSDVKSSIADAIETFAADNGGQAPLAVVIIGENGAQRVWLDADLQTPDQLDWVAKHIKAAASLAQKMEPGAGIA